MFSQNRLHRKIPQKRRCNRARITKKALFLPGNLPLAAPGRREQNVQYLRHEKTKPRACLKNVNMPTGRPVSTIFRQIFLKSIQDSCENFASSGENIPHHLAHCLFLKQGLVQRKKKRKKEAPPPFARKIGKAPLWPWGPD